MIVRATLLALAALAVASAATAQELRMVPVTVDGSTVRLAMRVYTPPTPEPAPTLVFNHGSTGRGTDPTIMVRPIDFPPLAKFFTDRGWAVVMPARRGRGGSEGLYDEGFNADRSLGYACNVDLSLPGADRGLRDIDAAMDAILAMPFVDRSRIVVGGQSRGGILSVAYAGRRPDHVKGVINFVGGWLGERCHVSGEVNQTLMRRGAAYRREMLWLYGDNDPFYSLAHSRKSFEAFQKAGGVGAMHEFPPPPDTNGHRISGYPDLWTSVVESYLTRLGLPARPR